ncbi:polysaccharide deacetylase family protein [[Clostridium] dakarense]|uniref:polysaccharide deacetylase family protein n=1 Tax=Faecalimicrobium dakarense TaxID=1301100 RepID=UPI00137751A3|nr:polysaccharide deacetylase family protein [[Clostridium] dakarense]
MWNKIVENTTKSQELTTYNVYEDDFEKQMMQLIDAGAYFATPQDLVRFRDTGNYPDKCVWISFDDVDETVFNVAFPILKEKQIPFTLFVISGQVGNDNFNNLKMANWNELREMRDSGLASFGSHTHDMHYLEDDKAEFLHSDKYDELKKDINLSKKTMEKELGIPINSIAYPFGEASEDIIDIIREEGFTEAYILSPYPIDKDNDPYYQNRYLINKKNFDKGVLPWIDDKTKGAVAK